MSRWCRCSVPVTRRARILPRSDDEPTQHRRVLVVDVADLLLTEEADLRTAAAREPALASVPSRPRSRSRSLDDHGPAASGSLPSCGRRGGRSSFGPTLRRRAAPLRSPRVPTARRCRCRRRSSPRSGRRSRRRACGVPNVPSSRPRPPRSVTSVAKRVDRLLDLGVCTPGIDEQHRFVRTQLRALLWSESASGLSPETGGSSAGYQTDCRPARCARWGERRTEAPRRPLSRCSASSASRRPRSARDLRTTTSRGVFVTVAVAHSRDGPTLSTSISMTVRF